MSRVSIVLLALIVLGACSSEPEECTIRPSGQPGIRILECPGGRAQIAGGSGEASCILTLEKEGWKRVSCSDGTSVLLDPDGNVHYPGSGEIEGTALLAGTEGDHAGIRVRAAGTPFETRTNAEGRFVLGGLPAGLYRVVLEYEGRVPVVRENVPVVNGSYSIGSVELSAALRLSKRRDAEVIPSPSSDSLLIVEATEHGKLLSLLHLETWERISLSSNAHAPSYRFDGRKVLWTENLTSRSRIFVYDVDTAEREMLPVEGMEAVFFADGRAILVRQEVEFVDRLTVYDTLDGTSIPLGPFLHVGSELGKLPMGPDGGSVVYRASSQLFLYDHENRESLAIAGTTTNFEDIHYHPSGRLVAVNRQDAANSRSLLLIDLSRGTTTTLAAQHAGTVLHRPEDGSLLWRENGGWRLWDGETQESMDVPFPDSLTSEVFFLPDGSGVVQWDLPTVRLWKRGQVTVTVLSHEAMGTPLFTRDGKYLVLRVSSGGLRDTLVIRLSDERVEVIEEHGWGLGPGPNLLIRQASDHLSYYEPGKEVGTISATIVTHWSGTEDKMIVLGRPKGGDLVLGIWEGPGRRLEWLTSGTDPSLSRNGRYLFFRACLEGVSQPAGACTSHLFRVDLVTGTYDRIAPHTDAGVLHERFLLYRVLDGSEDEGLYLARADR